MEIIDPAQGVTVSIAQVKNSQLHRQKIWRWRCGVCGKRGNKNTKIRNNMSATYHAQENPGHNVLITYWTSEGEVLDCIAYRAPENSRSEDPPF